MIRLPCINYLDALHVNKQSSASPVHAPEATKPVQLGAVCAESVLIPYRHNSLYFYWECSGTICSKPAMLLLSLQLPLLLHESQLLPLVLRQMAQSWYALICCCASST